MLNRFKYMFLLIIALSVSSAFSCSGKYFKVRVKNAQAVNDMQCLAIIPLLDLPDSAGGSSILTDLISSSVTGRSIFRIVPQQAVEKQMNLIGVFDGGAIDVQAICEIGKKVGAAGVLTGSVTEYGYLRQPGGYSQPKLGFSISLYDVSKCELVWDVAVARAASGVTGSYNESLSGLAMASVDEALDELSAEIKERALDFRFRCGPKETKETARCERGEGGWIDFRKCPEAVPYLRLGREPVSLEGDEIIFNERLNFVPGKNLIMSESKSLLLKLIEFLNRNNIGRIRIESYVSAASKEESKVSELNRAGEVRRFLLRNRLKGTRVDVANFAINPKLIKGREISNIRIVVLD